MAIGKCLKCDKVDKMTEDHVLPQWFKKTLPDFGIDPPTGSMAIHLLCQECNIKKGGKVDYSDPASREIVKQIVGKFLVAIREHEEFTP